MEKDRIKMALGSSFEVVRVIIRGFWSSDVWEVMLLRRTSKELVPSYGAAVGVIGSIMDTRFTPVLFRNLGPVIRVESDASLGSHNLCRHAKPSNATDFRDRHCNARQ